MRYFTRQDWEDQYEAIGFQGNGFEPFESVEDVKTEVQTMIEGINSWAMNETVEVDPHFDYQAVMDHFNEQIKE